MSDLLSPILTVMEDEVDTFWCFVGLMDRMVAFAFSLAETDSDFFLYRLICLLRIRLE